MRAVVANDVDDDAPLLQAARGGDRAAFSSLVRRHARAAGRLAARLLGNKEDAEDVVQDAFVKAYRNLDGFRGEAPFRAWLLRITLHLCQDHLRARSRRNERAAQEPDRSADALAGTEPEPSRTAAAKDETERLRRAIELLPPRQKTALLLKVYDGLPHAEIAAVLGTSVTAARVYLALARRALRRALPEAPSERTP